MLPYETPSRIWRRIEEAQNVEMPSLPSLPSFDHSGELHDDLDSDDSHSSLSAFEETHTREITDERAQSTPMQSIGSRTVRPASATSSRARFAASVLTSRSGTSTVKPQDQSFDVSYIPPPALDGLSEDDDRDASSPDLRDASSFAPANISLPDEYGEQELSLTEALGSISRGSSPLAPVEHEVDEFNAALSDEAPTRNSIFVATRRRAIPRLQEKFITSGGSLSSSSGAPTDPSRHSLSRSRSLRASQIDTLAEVTIPTTPAAGPSSSYTPHTQIRVTPLEPHPEEIHLRHSISSSRRSASPISRGASRDPEPSMLIADPLDTPMPRSKQKRFQRSASIESSPSSHPSQSLQSIDLRSNPRSQLSNSGGSIGENAQDRRESFEKPPLEQEQEQEEEIEDALLDEEASPEGTQGEKSPSQSSDDDGDGARSPDEAPPPRNTGNLLQTFSSPIARDMRSPSPASYPYPTTTPVTDRHKSFLLSLVQSGGRPRFVAPTPHPRHNRPRMSHPLAQVHTPASIERDSFISTASSHDLAARHRANASFDPTTDVAPRFDTNKLNRYLQGLTRQLVAENKGLKESEEAVGVMSELIEALQEELAHTKAERDSLREEGEAFADEFQKVEREREMKDLEVDALRKEVDDVKAEMKRRSAVHETQTRELADGAEGIIQEIQLKLDQRAEEVTTLKERLNREGGAEADRVRAAEQRADAMRDARVHVQQDLAQATRELQDARRESSTLKDAAAQYEEKISNLEEAVQAEKLRVHTLEEEVQAGKKKHTVLQGRTDDAESALEAQVAKSEALEQDLTSAEERVVTIQAQLRQLEDALEESERKMRDDDEELRMMGKKMEYLAKERDQALAAQTEALASRNHTVVLDGNANTSISSHTSSTSSTVSANGLDGRSHIPLEEHEKIVQSLEAQLEDAEREIGRMAHAVKGSPASKAITTARALRVEALEKDNKELEEKVAALRNALQSFLPPTAGDAVTPRGKGTPQSAAWQRAAATLRTPKTPFGPLRDISWLNNTTNTPSFEAGPYVARIQELHGQLDVAGENLDHMVGELGEAGLSVVKLTEMLQSARGKVGELQQEITSLKHGEDRVRKRLERCKCLKCGRRFDASGLVVLAGNTSISLAESEVTNTSMEDPAKSREALQAALQNVNKELSALKVKWASEREVLVGEKEVLRDAAGRLNAEIKAETAERKRATEAAKNLKDDAAREKALLQVELDSARASVSTLETDLRQERARLRSLTTEQTRVFREKGEVLNKLGRTESDMGDVKRELDRLKQENRDLESELQRNSNADQKAQKLASKVSENQDLIEQLRRERKALTGDHADLQRRFSQISEQMELVRKDLAKSQASHDERRHQLDLRVTEIDDLRLALEEQAAELQQVEKEKNRLGTERAEVARTISGLESDLKRVRRDAEKFGRDLEKLRLERDRLREESEGKREGRDEQVKGLQEQVTLLQKKSRKVEEAMLNHACAADEETLAALRVTHNKECKGLIIQIRYLKAKFTRESAFRADLIYQKTYLLKTVEALHDGDQTILASIARVGFPLPPPPRKPRAFRTVVLAVIFAQRSQAASATWKTHTASKQAIANALQEVRRRRVGST